jgi:hypothetical protein
MVTQDLFSILVFVESTTMRCSSLILLFFSNAVLASQCKNWADNVARQWRSIFVPDDDFQPNDDIYDTTPNTKDYPWDLYPLKSYPDEAALPETTFTKPSIPAKFKRDISHVQTSTTPSKSDNKLEDVRKHIGKIKTHWTDINNLIEDMFSDNGVTEERDKMKEPPNKAQRKVTISIDL